MKTLKEIGNKVVHGAVDTTSSILGGVHFVATSVADGAMNAEAYLKEKAYGVDRETTKQERVFKTISKQVAISEALTSTKERIAKAKEAILSKKKEDKKVNAIEVIDIEILP